MSAFRELVRRDVKGVFLDENFFAEEYDVRYDGEIYPGLQIVTEKLEEKASPTLTMGTGRFESDNLNGVYRRSLVAYIDEKDLPVVPEQGKWIDFREGTAFAVLWRRYRIASSDVEMGVIELRLEAFDE